MRPATDHRPDVDGLRAVAVLAVLAGHAFPGKLPFGYLGVHVFFVISGYLITRLLVGEMEGGRVRLGAFYGRRIRRLFPAMLVVLTACLIAGLVLLRIGEFTALIRHLLASLAFVQNMNVAAEVGYFESAARLRPLLHLWSLSVEEQFYLLWPVLLLSMAKTSRGLVAVLTAVFTASLTLAVSTSASTTAYYSTLSNAWILAAGAALAVAELKVPHTRTGRTGRQLWQFLAGGALALLLASFIWSPLPASRPGLITLIPVAATVAIIAAGHGCWINRHLLGHRHLVAIGLISYPLYLWHWPLLAFPQIVLGETPPAVWRLGALAAAFALAALTWRYVERPLRYGFQAQRVVIGLVAGAAVLATVALASAAVLPLIRGERERLVDQQLSGPFWRYTRNPVCELAYGASYKDFCIQNRTGSPTVVLFGTSFANHFYAGLLEHPASRNEIILSYGSCEPSGIYPGSTSDCARQEAILAQSPTVRLVLVGSAWPRFGPDGRMVDNVDGAVLTDSAYPDASGYYAALTRRLGRIAHPRLRIVVLGPKPELDYDAALCFGRPVRPPSQSCEVSVTFASAQTDAIYAELNRVVDQVEGAVLIDQRPMVCTKEVCRFRTTEGLPLLRDNGHYSELGSRLATEYMFRTHPNLLTPEDRP